MTVLAQAERIESIEATGEISAQRLAELRAIPAREVVSVNVNVPAVVVTAVAAAPKVRALRSEICRVFREIDVALIDDLEERALVLNHLHGVLLATPKPRSAVAGAGEARRLRRHLTTLLKLLVAQGFIPRERMPKLRGSNSHLSIATDLNVLAKILGATFDSADTANIAVLADLDSARALAGRLLVVSEDRGARALALKAVTDLLARAFTALLRAYNEARCAVAFVRRQEGDADAIIPPLFSVRFKRKRRAAKRADGSLSASLPASQRDKTGDSP